MKVKTLLKSGVALSAALMLASCSQKEEPMSGNTNQTNEDMVEFMATVKLPDNFRTRAAAAGTVGEDGLYTFTREIDRLWYAVYYNGEYLYDSEQADTPATTKTADGHFKVPFKFHNTVDYSKVYIFFWAGNAEDNVTTNDVTSVTDGINLNFAKRCVSVDPKYMNGNNTELKQYDSFAGYVQLASSKDVSNFNVVATLHRPFAQIHVLSDEFVQPGVSVDFPNGLTVVPGFGTEEASASNYSTNLMAATTWWYDDSLSSTPSYSQNELNFTANNYEFTNKLTGVSPERVTFKERKMDYLGCFYVFAPIEKAPLEYAESDSNSGTLDKVNLAFRKVGDTLVKSEFASVDLPEDGIKANNKYVIYNKSLEDGGQGGFISKTFVFEVVTDPEWETPNSEISK